MQALIDGHMLGADETGNETYVRGLLAGLEAMGRRDAVAVRRSNVDVGAHYPVLLPRRSDAARLLTDLPAAARSCGADVIHSTYAAPPRASCARAVTVHDVSFLAYPEWFTPRDLAVLNAGVRFSVRRAERVIVPSTHARDELTRLLGCPSSASSSRRRRRTRASARWTTPRPTPSSGDTDWPGRSCSPSAISSRARTSAGCCRRGRCWRQRAATAAAAW